MANYKSRKHKCTPYLKDEDQLAKIVKQHIKDELDPSKNQLLWQGRTDEGVLENYQDFLTAVAQLGRYLWYLIILRTSHFSQFNIVIRGMSQFAL